MNEKKRNEHTRTEKKRNTTEQKRKYYKRIGK